jgi:hypothetical protein
LFDRAQRFEYADVKATAAPDRSAVPEISIGVPDLGVYDGLLAGAMGQAVASGGAA